MIHTLPIQVYYEDTDFSGVVYHPNYLKFFERAREHYLGVDLLVRLYREQELGLVVYHMEIDFKGAASHGDLLEVRSTGFLPTMARLVFEQNIWHQNGTKPLVSGKIELVCINHRSGIPLAMPQALVDVVALLN
jgi:acyl-CoA thioester hydrolase